MAVQMRGAQSGPGRSLARGGKQRTHWKLVTCKGEAQNGDQGGQQRLTGRRRPHTLSVFVGDEPGMINRVSGVFARRGFNIESLAVGLSNSKALFTVVAIGTDAEAEALRKQILKLINVKSVDNLTDVPTCEKGLMLAKVSPTEHGSRAELLQLASIFNARTVDVSEDELTIAVTGDPGKTDAVQRALTRYNIQQVARTGKLAISREPARSDARRKRLDLMDAVSRARELSEPLASGRSTHSSPNGADPNGSEEQLAQMVRSGSLSAPELEDIYKPVIGMRTSPVAQGDTRDAAGGKKRGPYAGGASFDDSADDGRESHTLSIRVENKPGVLDCVTGVIARRGYNVESVGVGRSESPEVSRITLVVPGTDSETEALLKQLYKLVSVLDAEDLTNVPFVEQELMMIKVRSNQSQRNEMMELVRIFNAKAADVSDDTMTIEVVGDLDKNAALQDLLEPYGILELARTGRVALRRSSGIDTRMLEDLEGSYALA